MFGTRNVAQAADKCKAKWFVMISGDKAVNPANVIGMSKHAAGMMVQAVRAETTVGLAGQ